MLNMDVHWTSLDEAIVHFCWCRNLSISSYSLNYFSVAVFCFQMSFNRSNFEKDAITFPRPASYVGLLAEDLAKYMNSYFHGWRHEPSVLVDDLTI